MDCLVAVLLAACCSSLFIMMLITAYDVGMRYFFNQPLTSAYELTEIFMGIMAPTSIVYCTYKRGHVSVDILYERLGRKTQAVVRFVADCVVLAAMSALAWQSWYLMVDLRELDLSSPTLFLPMWPLGCVFLLSFAFCVPILLRYMWTPTSRGGRP